MDLVLINNIVEQIKADKDRVNEYKGLDNIINMLSDEEFRYLLEQSGEDLFLNSTLALMVVENKPQQTKDFIIYFVDKYNKIADEKIKQAQQLEHMGNLTTKDMISIIYDCEQAKRHLTKFKTVYIIEIDNILKK